MGSPRVSSDLTMPRLSSISLLALLSLLLASCRCQPVTRTSGHTGGHSITTRDTQLQLDTQLKQSLGWLADRITDQLAESLKPLEHLKDLQNLETISEKLQSTEELRVTVDSGLRRISDSLLARAKIDNTLGLGL